MFVAIHFRAALMGGLMLLASLVPATPQSAAPPRYEYRPGHDPNGLGKFYLGREIAHVMGHLAADWLERPEREREENTTLLVASLDLKPGMVVADIGAGSGYLTRRLAGKIIPGGKVAAVDIQPEMLELLTNTMAQLQITNVEPVLGTITNANLPRESIDLVVMVDVYHEFSHPFEMMENICQALKPGGRVAFVEFRQEDPAVPIKAVHKMSERQVRMEAAIHELEWVKTVADLPWQHLILFRKAPLQP